MKNRTWIFEKRPSDKPTKDCFSIEKGNIPQPWENEILLETKFVSVDPYLRTRMSEQKSYTPGFNPGEPMRSGIIAEVTATNHNEFEKGEFVAGIGSWSDYQTSDGTNLQKVDADVAPLSAYLAILGMPGLTAYLGLMEIGKPQKGETLVVSGAAGAVGSVVGQIGKIKGCRVVGIAGGEEKTGWLKNDLEFDEAIDYKSTRNVRKAISAACPDGVDIYFDNVGGGISDGVMMNINKFARTIICGAISQYNENRLTTGPRIQSLLLINSAMMKGFIVRDYSDKFPEAMQQLTKWYRDGKLKYKETVVEGFEKIPEAFIGLFEGKNIGKMIVKV